MVPLPLDRPLHAHRRLLMCGTGVALYILVGLLRRVPGAVEAVYSTLLGPVIVRAIAFVSGPVPFSIAEWMVIGYAGWIIAAAGATIRAVATRRRRLLNAIAGGATRAARDIGVILTLFYGMWGFNYARPPFESQLGWPEWSGSSAEEILPLLEELVSETNGAYRAIHQSDDAGTPTHLSSSIGALTKDLDAGWEHTTALFELPGPTAWHFGRVKLLVATPIVGRFGIAGFYFPWTGEANLLRGMPAVTLPRRAGHEMAHQRGFGSEAESNFLGFVAAALAPNHHARYSALLFAQLQVMSVARRLAPDSARVLAEQMVPGIRRDLDDLDAYFERFRGPGTAVGHAVNDQFLRANRVPGGIQNYDRVTRLLIQFSRENGGSAVPRPAP